MKTVLIILAYGVFALMAIAPLTKEATDEKNKQADA